MKKLFIWVSTYNLFFIMATVVGDVTQKSRQLVNSSCSRRALHDFLHANVTWIYVSCCDFQIQWGVGDGAGSSGGHSIQSSAGAVLPAYPGKTSSLGCMVFNYSHMYNYIITASLSVESKWNINTTVFLGIIFFLFLIFIFCFSNTACLSGVIIDCISNKIFSN